MNGATRLGWLRNVGSGYANAAVGGVVFVLVTPVLVHKLGVAAFAVWVLAQTITLYLHFFDGGLHNAQVRYHAHFAARGREREVRALISTTVLALLAAGVLAALCGALIAISPAPWFRQLPAPLAADFRLVLFILSANLLIDIPAQALENIFEGAQRFDVRNLRMLAFRIITAAAQVALLLLGFGLVSLAIAEFACTAASILVDVFLIRRIFPGLLSLGEGFSWRLWRQIRRYAFWSYLDDLLAEGTAQLDKLLLAVFLPIVALTPYALSLSLASVLFVAVAPVTETFFPMAASLRAGRQREDLARLLVDGSKAVTALAAPLAVFFCCFGDRLLHLWIPEGAATLPAGLVTLVTLNSLVGVYLWTFTVLLMAANRVRLVAILTLIEVAIEVALVLLLVRGYQLLGLAMAGLTAHALIGFGVKIPIVARGEGVSVWSIVAPSLGRLCLASAPAVMAGLLLRNVLGSDWWSLAAAAAIVGIVYVLCLLLLGLTSRDRSRLARLWQHALGHGGT